MSQHIIWVIFKIETELITKERKGLIPDREKGMEQKEKFSFNKIIQADGVSLGTFIRYKYHFGP